METKVFNQKGSMDHKILNKKIKTKTNCLDVT